MVWLVVVNTNACRIYLYKKKPKTLILIKAFNHPQSKLKNTELTSDRPGHYNTSHGTRGAYADRTDAKEAEIEHFAIEIAHELNSQKSKQEYKNLILMGQPHISGLIQKHLDAQVNDCIIKSYNKNYTNLTEMELLKLLKEPIQIYL